MSPDTSTANVPPDPAGITADKASTLLQLAMSGPRRPVDDLLDRLAAPDGPQWMDRALEHVAGEEGQPRALLAEGRATLEQLRRIKETGKHMLRANGTDNSLIGIAGYFLAIAAGLRHHGTLIGGRGRSELEAILLDLATVAPAPYCTLLSEAAMVGEKL